LTPNLDMVIE